MDSPNRSPINFERILNAFAAALAPYISAHLKEAQPTGDEPKESQLLTQQEAADFLKCNVNTLIKWGKKGLVWPLKRGNKVYYRKADLLAANDTQKP